MPQARLQPAPFRVPLLDESGQLVESWRRFFLSTSDLVNFMLQAIALGTPRVGFAPDDADVGDGWVIPGPAGAPGPTGPAGAAGVPNMDGLDPDEPWPMLGVSGVVRSGVAGLFSPVVAASGRTVGASAALPSVAAFTIGASDASFLVSMNILITAWTAGTVSGVVTYTDEGGTARSLTLNFSAITGVLATTAGAAGAFEGVPLAIRVKAATVITCTTTVSIFTGVYNCEAYLTQLG
jgi:hypothetical protein